MNNKPTTKNPKPTLTREQTLEALRPRAAAFVRGINAVRMMDTAGAGSYKEKSA